MRLVYRVSCDELGGSIACAWNSQMAQSSLSQIRVVVQYHESVKLSTKDKGLTAAYPSTPKEILKSVATQSLRSHVAA